MNSHFQSSETTWTVTGVTLEPIGLRGSRSWAPTQATPPTSSTVMAGMDQKSNSRPPGKLKTGQDGRRGFDGPNQKEKAGGGGDVGKEEGAMVRGGVEKE